MSSINFFTEEINFSLKDENKLRHWISEIVSQNNKILQNINYIFTSDMYLSKINEEYLDHKTLTDIVTFDQSSEKDIIEGDIYISVDTVRDNAKKFNCSFNHELHRVMIHGVLHLLGFNDKTPAQKKEMRKNENHYLALRF